MDCVYHTPQGRFNYRVGAVIAYRGRLLGVHDQRDSAHFHYLPGGRVRLHETMEEALCRELWEELGVKARVVRPLWLWESAPQENHHSLEVVFLTELDWEALPSLTEPFHRPDTDGQQHFYNWLALGDSPDYIFPDFIQKSFPRLPECLTLVSGLQAGAAEVGQDCKFLTQEGLFNFRAAAVMVHEGKLLAMKEDRIAHWYLPGGRVRLGETMGQAALRELGEELGIGAKLLRPLWFCESFFALGDLPVHELAMYFLAQPDWQSFPSGEREFVREDTDKESHIFRWLDPREVTESALYPLVLQENFPGLPQRFSLVSDIRDRKVISK